MMFNDNAYPTNFDFSDDSFSCFSQPLFIEDDSWSNGDNMFPSSDNTLPSCKDGLDAFQEMDLYEDSFSGMLSDTVTTDDEVSSSTSLPSSPNPFVENEFVKRESDQDQLTRLHQQQLYAQCQQLQSFQLFLQQKLYLSLQQQAPVNQRPLSVAPVVQPTSPTNFFPVKTPDRYSLPYPVKHVPIDGYCYDVAKSYDEPAFGYPETTNVTLTNLDTSHFGSQNASMSKIKTIPVDVSGNLSDPQYNKIFKKYHQALHLDSHPIMTKEDLEEIKIYGRMYFLKNVKTIVPKIGPWKFNAHISHRRTDERQYNIPGMAVTCKVKEWLTDEGLWRLYHYKKGKTVKPKKQTDY